MKYLEEVRVVVVATGGLSHQLHGRRFGHLAPDFDSEWLDRLTTGMALLGLVEANGRHDHV
jgi:protocatechuate 4,5-dioxygenase beta chain